MKFKVRSAKFERDVSGRWALARRISAGVIALSFSVALFAQQRDAAAPASGPVGTAEISGVVVSAETNPQPMRRAVVTLSGGIPNPRSVLTDEAGRFTFGRLPAGTYNVTARKAAYIAAPYGARKPGRAGVPVVLSEGQRADLKMSMFRGAAITGYLRDASGSPVGGVDVRVIDARTLLTMADSSPPELATTDDRGVFRIYGLLPGDYFVVALPPQIGRGEIVAPPAALVDAALATLAGRTSMSPTAAPALPQRLSPVGFAPIYYPGTPNHYEAARVHVDIGEERAGVSFELSPVRIGAVEGVVSGNVPNLAAVQVTLIPAGPRIATGMSSNSLSGRPIDAQGTFRYSNLPPGRYRIVAKARRGEAETSNVPTVVNGVAQGGGGRVGTPVAGTAAAPSDYLYGFADVELRGEDVVNVSLGLQPGGVISGRIVFNGTGATPKPEDLSKLRPNLSLDGSTGTVSSNGLIMGGGLISNPPSTVRPDGTFEIRGIGPGRFAFSVFLPSGSDAGSWKLRTAMSADRNLLDDLIDLGPGTDLKDIVVTFSDARTEISGTLQTGAGILTTDYYIVAIPSNRTMWRATSGRVRSVRPATDGRFLFADLPAGEYLIAALTDLDPIDLTDSAFLEQVAPAGVKVAVAEGERKVQDLRIR